MATLTMNVKTNHINGECAKDPNSLPPIAVLIDQINDALDSLDKEAVSLNDAIAPVLIEEVPTVCPSEKAPAVGSQMQMGLRSIAKRIDDLRFGLMTVRTRVTL